MRLTKKNKNSDETNKQLSKYLIIYIRNSIKLFLIIKICRI